VNRDTTNVNIISPFVYNRYSTRNKTSNSVT